jgi:DNA-binding NarL/FixJ family response regulator
VSNVGPGRGGPSKSPRWRIAVVEDHLLQRQRTEELLGGQAGLGVVSSVETLPEFIAWSRTIGVDQRPHLLVLDLVVDRGPNADPSMVAEVIASGTQVLVLSAMASPVLVREMLQAGAAGIVGKRDPEEAIVAAVWSVLGNRRWMSSELAAVLAGDEHRPHLSEQESRALVLYGSGLTLDAVAAALGVRPDTAKTYLDRVRRKYAEVGRTVRSKVELSRAATEDGFILNPPVQAESPTLPESR